MLSNPSYFGGKYTSYDSKKLPGLTLAIHTQSALISHLYSLCSCASNNCNKKTHSVCSVCVIPATQTCDFNSQNTEKNLPDQDIPVLLPKSVPGRTTIRKGQALLRSSASLSGHYILGFTVYDVHLNLGDSNWLGLFIPFYF